MDKSSIQLAEAEIDKLTMTPREREEAQRKAERLAMLQRLRITPDMNLPPLEFLFNMLGKPCFPRGEVVTVTGKPKSGKTFFLSLLMTACTTDRDVIGIRRTTDSPPLKCLWYDTEQCQQSTREIIADRIRPVVMSAGKADVQTTPSDDTPPDSGGEFPEEMYDIFNSRSLDFSERMELLESAIAHCHPDLVVIDGICDLIRDINDGTTVKAVVENLMRTAQAHDCCIVCAIHQNKGAEDRNPRGWIGTELNNKSFEVYACELLKPEMIFAVEQMLSRRYRMDSLFYFVVDDNGMPHHSEGPETTADNTSEKKNYPHMNDAYVNWIDDKMTVDIRSLFCDVLKNGPLFYTPLQQKAMELLGCKDTGYWNNLFQQAKNQRVIINSHDNNGKSIWTLPPKAAPAVELDLMPIDEAPPY